MLIETWIKTERTFSLPLRRSGQILERTNIDVGPGAFLGNLDFLGSKKNLGKARF